MDKAMRALGTKLQIGAEASAVSVAGLTSIGGLELSADTIDITTLGSDGGYREFPELEVGDVIQLESKSDDLVSVRVLENALTIQQGRVSGTTKVRRLT